MRIVWILVIAILWPQQMVAKVVLQPHQKYSVDYFYRNKNQRGLLIYHGLGTGKTYLSLAFAEKYQKYKVLVLVPRFLKSNWQIQMKSFGVKNPGRYQLMSLREAKTELTKLDMRNTIVIIDEVHKLIDNLRYGLEEERMLYSEVYFKLWQAFKILALSGTPIFHDASDIAYTGNLLQASDIMPLNLAKFREEYMKIKPWTALLRGHFLESKLSIMFTPIYFVVTAGLFAPASLVATGVTALLGSGVILQLNSMFPAYRVSFREFNVDKLKDFALHYVSYYNPDTDRSKDYPSAKKHIKAVEYTKPQTHFFLDFVDENLSVEHLRLLLGEEANKYTPSYLRVNSYVVQKELLGQSHRGREIGNLPLLNRQGQMIEPSKFKEIVQLIRGRRTKVAVYSNYYENGIMQLASYLDRSGFKGKYLILHPEMPVEKQVKAISDYNSGKRKIIMLHPEITEGVSLVGTRQLHVLEPIQNIALLDQVVGRVVRFKSHSHLPKKERHVDIYLWESVVRYSNMFFWPSEAAYIRHEHWQEQYAEVNPSMWTKGIVEIDRNYFLKDESPDSRVRKTQGQVSADMASFKVLVEKYSIEKLR